MIKTIMGCDFNFFKQDKTVGGNTVHYVVEPENIENENMCFYWPDYNINEYRIGDMIFSFTRSKNDDNRFECRIFYFYHFFVGDIEECDWSQFDILFFVDSIDGLPDTSITKCYVNIKEV